VKSLKSSNALPRVNNSLIDPSRYSPIMRSLCVLARSTPTHLFG